MKDLGALYSLILKDGLSKYKYKNSKIRPLDCPSETKGSIFVYRSKEHLTCGRGLILTSEEALIENQDNFTHWTPNVFRYGTYRDDKRTIPEGHKENNLRQINCFFIDFDLKSETITEKDILCRSLELSYMPTMILKTDHGYQAYFVLESPAFVTAKSKFKVTEVAKEISQNLREFFAETLPETDLSCNHFGLARIPRTDNIVFLDTDYVYDFATWIKWSMTRSDMSQKYKRRRQHKPDLTLLNGSEGSHQVDEPWFKLLFHCSEIRGSKGVRGRNSVMFTLALAYFSSGRSQETCEYNLLNFNAELEEPLPDAEVIKLTRSAYSGAYKAAHWKYIIPLCHEWVSDELTSKDLFLPRVLYTFKKPRSQRKYSHLKEWREDLLKYLKENAVETELYLTTTKKEIREAIKIPERSLDKLLKELKSENVIFFTSKSGRGGGIQIALINDLMWKTVQATKAGRQAIFERLEAFLGKAGQLLKKKLMEQVEALIGSKYDLIDIFDSG